MLKNEMIEDPEETEDLEESEDFEESEDPEETEDLEESEDPEESFLYNHSIESDEPISNLEGYLRSEEFQSSVSVSDSIDYTSYFENIQTVLIFQTTVIIALGLLVAWVSGNKPKNIITLDMKSILKTVVIYSVMIYYLKPIFISCQSMLVLLISIIGQMVTSKQLTKKLKLL